MNATRILSLMLALLGLKLGSGSNLYINLGGSALVVDFELNQVIGDLDAAYPLGDSGFCALKEKGESRLYIADARGNRLSENEYDGARALGDLLLLCKDGRWALFDRALNPLTEFDYSAIYAAGEHFYAFKTELTDDNPDRLYILDRNGTETETEQQLLYAYLEFSGGLAAAMSAATGRFGYIDEVGSWAIEPYLLWADAFNEGLACASASGGSGLIDAQGRWALSPLYDDMILSDDYVICRENQTLYVYYRSPNGLIMLINEKGTHAASLGEFVALYRDDYVYLIDSEGETRALFTPDTLLFGGLEGEVIASDKNGMYVFNPNENILSEFFDYIEPLPTAFAYRCAKNNEDGTYSYGLISSALDTLMQPQYSELIAPGVRLIAAYNDGKIDLYAVSATEARRVKSVELP